MERRTLIKGAALGAVAPVIGATGAAAQTTGRAGLGTTNGKSIISTEHAITAEPFGTLPDGSPVERWTLTNRRGAQVRILSYGGIVQSLEVPDRHGALGNVALGYPDLGPYAAGNPTYFGALIGRYGNRIAKGRFTLDGHTYQLPVNDGPNSLHGGKVGFDKHIWSVEPAHGPDPALVLKLTSPDGDQGYPGTLHATVRYTWTGANALHIEYQATTDKPTIVNLTNHTYFNLAGEGSLDVYGHELQIDAARYTPVDSTSIPTGELAPVAGTPFDFRRPKPIGRDITEGSQQLLYTQGYDHNWVLDKGITATPERFARFAEQTSGRVMTVATTEPGVQFYSGNFMTGTFTGTSGRIYRQGSGLAFETQHFPDSPNHPNFPSTVLRPGRTYRSHTIYAFSAR